MSEEKRVMESIACRNENGKRENRNELFTDEVKYRCRIRIDPSRRVLVEERRGRRRATNYARRIRGEAGARRCALQRGEASRGTKGTGSRRVLRAHQDLGKVEEQGRNVEVGTVELVQCSSNVSLKFV
jgi:hypothetical protein